MLTNTWSLILFTILVQASVGLVVVSEAVRLTTDGAPGHQLGRQTLVACILAALGLAVSLTHLGAPQNSVMAILNVGQSWLSREIMATGIYFLSLLALAVLRLKSPGKPMRGLGLLSVLLGLVTVSVMSNVYLLDVVPVWDTIATVLSFFGTALLTGAVAGGLLLALQTGKADTGQTSIYCLAAIVGLALQFLGIPLSVAAAGTASNIVHFEPAMVFSASLGLLSLRIVLVFAGTAVFAWIMLRSCRVDGLGLPVNLSVFAMLCVVAGELIGRFMFYGSFMRLGL